MAAALSGAFVVNGSPTQTQVADSAGGRSQLTQLTTSAAVLLVLLLLTGPLASLPIAALARSSSSSPPGSSTLPGCGASWPAGA